MEAKTWKGRIREHEQSYSTRRMNGLEKEGRLPGKTWLPVTRMWQGNGITSGQKLLIAVAVRMVVVRLQGLMLPPNRSGGELVLAAVWSMCDGVAVHVAM